MKLMTEEIDELLLSTHNHLITFDLECHFKDSIDSNLELFDKSAIIIDLTKKYNLNSKTAEAAIKRYLDDNHNAN